MQLRQHKIIRFFPSIHLLGLLFLLNGCAEFKKAIVHNYPQESTFVFSNRIQINDADNKLIEKQLVYELDNYWDDSLKAKHFRQFGVFNTLLDPVRYQPDRMPRTLNYMQAYLSTLGYNHAQLTPKVKIDTVKKEWRALLTMQVQLNKKTIVDTVVYQLNNDSLQAIALANQSGAFLKKGVPYSNEIINNELDRLVEVFRSNGYYNFTKEKIFAEIDTIDAKLMQLEMDPLNQFQQILTAENRTKKSPGWRISIQLRNSNDLITKKYAIGNQIFYSDLTLNDNPDTILLKKANYYDTLSNVIHAFQKPKFKSILFQQQSIIQKGTPYNEKLFYQTLNNFSGLGAWQQIDARTTVVNDSIYLHYLLVPAIRRSVSMDLEGSRNTTELTAGNLIGLATSLTYRDKNVQRRAIPSISSIRGGIELNLNNSKESLTQTLLWNVGHSYNFPNILIPFTPRKHSYNYVTHTNFSINGSSIDRLDYYQLKSLTSNWGYEWKKTVGNDEQTFIYKPINVEIYYLNKFSKLENLLVLNPFLRSSFNEGNIVSQSFTYLHTGPSKRNPSQQNYIRLGMEEAGGIALLAPSLQKNIYTYLKTEIELRKVIKYSTTELAFRFLGGWGNNYSKHPDLGGQLPFFKQFTAGGPYSMRAWGLRQLGLGGSRFYDTTRTNANFDRFGDLQLEGNIEYRFNLLQWSSYKLGSAIFMDMGNIWNTRDIQADPDAGFKLNKLYKDLAIGIGSGLRFDFNYFIVRIDFGFKVKDPTRVANNGWMDVKNWKWTDTKSNGLKVNNYAWQFGIGLPF